VNVHGHSPVRSGETRCLLPRAAVAMTSARCGDGCSQESVSVWHRRRLHPSALTALPGRCPQLLRYLWRLLVLASTSTTLSRLLALLWAVCTAIRQSCLCRGRRLVEKAIALEATCHGQRALFPHRRIAALSCCRKQLNLAVTLLA